MRGMCVDQPTEQVFVDAAAKTNNAVDFYDWNARPKSLLQFGIGIDIDFVDRRQIVDVTVQDRFSVVA